jgi:hypothetical protein
MLVDARPVVLLPDVEADAVGPWGREVGGRRGGVREDDGEQEGVQNPEHVDSLVGRVVGRVSYIATLYAESA